MARSKNVAYVDPFQISASQLRFQVVIMKRELVQDSALGFTQMWKPIQKLPSTWAGIQPASAREITIAAQMGQTVSHMVRMRFRKDLTIEHSLKYNGRVFSICSLLNVGERNRVLELKCEEQFEKDERGN